MARNTLILILFVLLHAGSVQARNQSGSAPTPGSAPASLNDQVIADRIKQEIAVQEDNLNFAISWAAIERGALDNPLAEGGQEDQKVLINGPNEYYVASTGDWNRQISVNQNSFVDIRHLKIASGHPLRVYVYPGSTSTIVKDHSGNNDLIAENSMVEILKDINGGIHYNVISGSVKPGAGRATPVCDQVIITGGQSLANRFTSGAGLYGFMKGWREFNGDQTTKFWFENGAKSGSGLVPASNPTRYWWDPVTQSPGPNALAWKSVLDEIPINQPAPSAIFWIFGQTDAGAIGTDPSLSLSAYKASYLALFKWMQDQIDPKVRTPIIIFPLGAFDNAFNATAQAVRWVEMEIIAENNWAHQGPAYFDLPRGFGDVHHGQSGEQFMGYRTAAIFDNLINAAGHPEGPTVTGIAEADGGLKYEITIQQQKYIDFTRPLAPEGFAIFARNADPITDRFEKPRSYNWTSLGGGAWKLTIELFSASPGGTVVFPYGAIDYVRRGRWPRNIREFPLRKAFGNFYPLRHFKSGAF